VKLAVDFSGARPDPGELARLNLDALGYVGSFRPDQTYLDALTSAGVRFTFIFETDPNRSQQGYQAGRLDAQFFEQRVKERGYPPTMPAMVVVSDGTATSPSSGGNAIADYGRGWADTTTRPLCAYGNRYAVDAFNRGVPASRLLARGGGWLPIPWGGNAAQDVMGQDANTPSPIPGTDLNRVWVDYFAPSPPPAPLPRKRIPMSLMIVRVDDGRQELWDGNRKIRNLYGTANQYGMTPGTVALASQGIPVVDFVAGEWDAWWKANMVTAP